MEGQVKMNKKEKLLELVEELKQNIEDGDVTSLVVAGSNEKGNIYTKIVATGITSLGLAKFINERVEKVTYAEAEHQDLQNFLSKFMDDDN